MYRMPDGTEDDLVTILTVKGASKQEKADILTYFGQFDYDSLNSRFLGISQSYQELFNANQTPLEYFVALARFFKYIKNTDFVIENPTYSAYDEIKTFGLDVKNEGTVIIDNSENDI